MNCIGTYDWTVLGGDLPGMAAIGKLLDMGENESRICWIDRQFTVTVPSCERTLAHFLYSSPSLRYCECDHAPPDQALNWILEHLYHTVDSRQMVVEGISPDGNEWQVGSLRSKRVIVAGGNESGNLAPGLLALASSTKLSKVHQLLNRHLPALSH